MSLIYSISRRDENGFAQVHVRFYNGRACDLRAKTRVFVPRSAWNEAEGRCNISRRYETPENVKARKAQAQLDELAKRITDAYASAGGVVDKAWLQRVIDKEIDEQPIAETIDRYCEAKNAAPRTKYKLHALRQHILRFEKEKRRRLYAHTINRYDLDDFVEYLRLSDLSNNSVACRMRQLRALVYWAGKPYPNPFDGYSMPQENYGDPFFLTKEEVEHIATFDNLTPAKKLQRDIFIFQCSVGCRVSDLYALTPANIKDGWLIYMPQKTSKGKGVVVEVPLSPLALEIIERHKHQDLKGRLFPFISDVKYNLAIRYVLKAADISRPVVWRNPHTGECKPRPIYEIASSHLARRTFAQIVYSTTGDRKLTASMTGHSEDSKAFNRYSEITREMKQKVFADILPT